MFLNKYPGVNGHSKIEEALLKDYDGYTIATPAKTHFEIAKTIINAQKNVLIEKPMALSIEEAEQLVVLSEKNKINAMVGHVLLFHPAVKKIKELLKRGDIGDLRHLYSNRLNLGKVRTEENVFWSLARMTVQSFNISPILSQRKLMQLAAHFYTQGIPDSTLTQLEYENGVKGHIFVAGFILKNIV